MTTNATKTHTSITSNDNGEIVISTGTTRRDQMSGASVNVAAPVLDAVQLADLLGCDADSMVRVDFLDHNDHPRFWRGPVWAAAKQTGVTRECGTWGAGLLAAIGELLTGALLDAPEGLPLLVEGTVELTLEDRLANCSAVITAEDVLEAAQIDANFEALAAEQAAERTLLAAFEAAANNPDGDVADTITVVTPGEAGAQVRLTQVTYRVAAAAPALLAATIPQSTVDPVALDRARAATIRAERTVDTFGAPNKAASAYGTDALLAAEAAYRFGPCDDHDLSGAICDTCDCGAPCPKGDTICDDCDRRLEWDRLFADDDCDVDVDDPAYSW